MTPVTLEKLDWPLLTATLGQFCHTDEGLSRCEQLLPRMNGDEIAQEWAIVEDLRVLLVRGYRPPLAPLPDMRKLLRGVALGQVLDGPDLLLVARLLDIVVKVSGFSRNVPHGCGALRRFAARCLPLPALWQEIDRAIAPSGELRDDASPTLGRLRRDRLARRRNVEEKVKALLHNGEFEQYLQDEFFTLRDERYVVPIRLDGRGRIAGAVLDTSDSGQTLFVEPAAIKDLNDELSEIDVSIKLEILRIYRDLSGSIAEQITVIEPCYDEVVSLDVWLAKADLAARWDARPVALAEKPTLNLVGARHPLVRGGGDGEGAIANTIQLGEDGRCLVISGPNAGGKTVVLKTVGLLHLMARGGLLLPVDAASTLYPFAEVLVELGDNQSIESSLSTFSAHILGLKPVLDSADGDHLVLLDELAVGTEPLTGAALARAILEDLANRNVTSLATTHYDELKTLALNDKRFRNGCMEYSLSEMRPTYRLVLDLPGRSFGLEVARQLGLKASVLERAEALRGVGVSRLDEAIQSLAESRERNFELQRQLTASLAEAADEKLRWEEECRHLQEHRSSVVRKIRERYEGEFEELRGQIQGALRALRQAATDAASSTGNTNGDATGKPGEPGASSPREELQASMRRADEAQQSFRDRLAELTHAAGPDEMPGRAVADEHDIHIGSTVFIIPLRRTGIVTKVADGSIEAQVGLGKVRPRFTEIRLLDQAGRSTPTASLGSTGGLSRSSGPGGESPSIDWRGSSAASSKAMPVKEKFSAANTIDIRGMKFDDAMDAVTRFIDRGVMRGEVRLVIVHGAGTGALKSGVRDWLASTNPYGATFRPGADGEGGDGVTLVNLG